MNNQVMLFDFKGNQVRTVMIDDEPSFVGRDVALILGYSRPSDAIRKIVKTDDKGVSKIETPGGRQKVVIINDSGLYSLILSSKLPKAQDFQSWVTKEVLPSIRKHGSYVEENTLDNWLNDPDTMIKTLTALKKERENNAKLKPKADYFDKQLDSKGGIKTSVLAQNYGLSARKFNQLLHDHHIQWKQGENWLLYAEHKGKGYVIQREFEYEKDKIHTTMLWTPKGKKFIYEKLKVVGIVPTNESERLKEGVNNDD